MTGALLQPEIMASRTTIAVDEMIDTIFAISRRFCQLNAGKSSIWQGVGGTFAERCNSRSAHWLQAGKFTPLREAATHQFSVVHCSQ